MKRLACNVEVLEVFMKVTAKGRDYLVTCSPFSDEVASQLKAGQWYRIALTPIEPPLKNITTSGG